MRITQNMTYRLAVDSMQATSNALATTQEQLSTGDAFQTAGQDPVDAGQVLALNTQLAGITADGKTLGTAQLNLQYESQALTSAQNILTQARSLALQANNATMDATSRQAIAQQIGGLEQQLVSVANSDTSSGQPLFGGDQSSGPAFVQDASGNVAYVGGDQVNWLQVDPTTALPAGDSGQSVFMDSPDGTSGLSVAAGSGNTGTLQITSASPPLSLPVPSFTLTFSAGEYTATAADGTVIATGAYSGSGSLTIEGITLSLTGTPADGDTVGVQAAGDQSIFATLNNLQAAVLTTDSTARANAIFTGVNALDAASTHLTDVNTVNAGRLDALTSLQASQGAQSTNIQDATSQLAGTDYAQAASQLSQLTTALQAAEQSFAKIQTLSLFQWID
ncbi:MAG: flagellar hook-associated protein FlgL [Rhodanobacteraceae bacterium]